MVETRKDYPTNRCSVAMLVLGSVLLLPSTGHARQHEHFGEDFSIDLNQPYEQVVTVVQKVANNGTIEGTFEYKGTHGLDGARSAKSSRVFPPWSGTGTVLYKEPLQFEDESCWARAVARRIGLPQCRCPQWHRNSLAPAY
jgi:hypothetical protein